MRLPKPLLRTNPKANKYDFGHVLVLAGSPSMLGAAALTALAAMRTGAGLVTCGIPKSLNLTLQTKLSPVVMTLPLPETRMGTLALSAFTVLEKHWSRFNAVALGPGLTQDGGTRKFILRMVAFCPNPLVIDADAINACATNLGILLARKGVTILTPHAGEMARLIGQGRTFVDQHRRRIALAFAKKYQVTVALKGYRTVVAGLDGKAFINPTGNVGMATAGTGDVLTGMIASLLAQGIDPFTAARCGVWLHGRAGDTAVKKLTHASLIASDLIEYIR